MDLKDYLRIFRRRIFWALGGAVITFVLFMGYFVFTQKPSYSARTKVLVEPPSQVSLAMQVPQRGYMTPGTLGTWQTLIAGASVRSIAMELIKKQDPTAQDGWFGGVSVSPEKEGTNLLAIDASAGTPEAAALLANNTAQAARDFSIQVANQHISEAIDAATLLTYNKKETDPDFDRSKWEKSKRKELLDAEAKRKAVLEKAGVQDLRYETERAREVLRESETRIRQLEQRLAGNQLRLQRIRLQRLAAQHLGHEPLPLEALSAQIRVQQSPRVQQVNDELQNLYREDRRLAATYTEKAPRRLSVQEAIKQKRLELNEAREEAVGRALDSEELTLLDDTDLAQTEINLLKDALPTARRDKVRLENLLQEYEAADKATTDLQATIANLESLITNLQATSKEGYVRLLPKEEAKAGSPIPFWPFALKNWPMGLILALVVGISVAYVRELMDSSLRTDYDVKRHLNLPVISDLPILDPSERVLLKAADGSFLAEKFDTLATLLQGGEQPVRTLLVTSSIPEEGKTMISVNLATSFARQGRRTLLIDCDLRVPTIHSLLHLQNGLGCADLLLGTTPLTTEGNLLREVGQENLKICLSGTRPENPYALLDPQRIRNLVEAARQHFDVVVIDSPPVLRTSDALKLAALVDATMLVVESGRTDMREATWAKRLLENVGARIVGVMLNKAGGAREQYYYYYYRHYSNSGQST